MDNFLVEKGIGEGTFSTVLKCLDQTNGEHVAVKKFGELNNSMRKEAIDCEYTLLAGLKHDNVIKVLSHFLEEGRLHIVFELMDHSIYDDIQESYRLGLEDQLLRKFPQDLEKMVQADRDGVPLIFEGEEEEEESFSVKEEKKSGCGALFRRTMQRIRRFFTFSCCRNRIHEDK
ncbi:hypothetical protein CRUP_003780 [Coryphaenoides rupestris]|nr:hypothetical protein CRUP_003780 [Coryphaenoides rupestris]